MPEASAIQAVLFDIDKFTPKDARRWLNKHGLRSIKKGHRTENYLRYRIRDPNDFTTFRTISVPGVGDDIKFILGFS